MAITTYGDISQRTAAWAAVQMLSHAEPILVLSKFGQNKTVPKNKANTVKFRRAIPFAINTTPLTEGVTPATQQIRYEDVQVTLAQYGEVTEITDVVHDLSEDPVLRDASILSGEQAAETIEMITFGVVKAGTNVIYTNGTARNTINSAISLNALRSAVRTIKNARGRQHTTMLSGSPDYNTTPIEGGYIAFGHTDLEADVRNIPGFVPVAEYGSRRALCPEELGTVENVRIILTPLLSAFADAGDTTTTMVSTSGTKADVYPLIVTGKEAYGLVPLKGEGAITPTVLNPGTPSKSDPLGQRGYVGWKTYYAAVRLNETWMVRIETGSTKL
jgi:N4-gp56 family major capsid protein